MPPTHDDRSRRRPKEGQQRSSKHGSRTWPSLRARRSTQRRLLQCYEAVDEEHETQEDERVEDDLRLMLAHPTLARAERR